jgi:hypothetical protein
MPVWLPGGRFIGGIFGGILRILRVLAALGPKMLELARWRADGAEPFLVPVEHTALVRTALGVRREAVSRDDRLYLRRHRRDGPALTR